MANSRLRPGGVVVVTGCLLAGCVGQGAIYSHTTRPLMTDFIATPVVAEGSHGDVKTVSFYVDVEWGEDGIGDIARRKGIAEVYYADVETVSVLSYWKRDLVRVYGRPMTAMSYPAR